MTVNNVVLVGRAGKDPESKHFESGKIKVTFSLATNRPTKNKETDWHNIEVWGKQAEIAAEYVRKGSLIGVTGSIQYESWTDNDSRKHYKTVIKANNVRLLGSKSDNQSAPDKPPEQAPDNNDLDSLFASEDEIPF